ncbi:hypothetical protein, partial [Ruminococcus sp.]|uniref:hypothetical protein n=1 Tax=Ruminococcus sp. TaxID=41978 RepID=UPI003F095ED6
SNIPTVYHKTFFIANTLWSIFSEERRRNVTQGNTPQKTRQVFSYKINVRHPLQKRTDTQQGACSFLVCG